MSPLTCILAFDTFSHMVNWAKISRTLVGVEFPEVGNSTILAIYADDAVVLSRAEMQYVLACQMLLEKFGAASGLCCKWE